jgi:hypothetical protein
LVEPAIGKENTMSDDTSLRAPQDASRISLEEDYEVRYWTKKWGVSREKLEEAVQQVGQSASAVAIYLQKPE